MGCVISSMSCRRSARCAESPGRSRARGSTCARPCTIRRSRPIPNCVFGYRDVQRAIRDEGWKMIRYPKIDRTQLFDLGADPLEQHDLAGESASASKLASWVPGSMPRSALTNPQRASSSVVQGRRRLLSASRTVLTCTAVAGSGCLANSART